MSKEAKRKGHRGWMMVSSSVDGVVHIRKQSWVASKLVGYPDHLIWPVEGDLGGAAVLVDAVMQRDALAIRTLERQHPEGGDFNLGDWWRQLKTTYVAKAQIRTQTLAIRHLSGGASLVTVCETDSVSGQRVLAAVIRRGKLVLGRRVLVRELIPADDTDAAVSTPSTPSTPSTTGLLEREPAHV